MFIKYVIFLCNPYRHHQRPWGAEWFAAPVLWTK